MSLNKTPPQDMRVGVRHHSVKCGDMEVISYRNSADVGVRFVNTGYITSKVQAAHVRRGLINDPLARLTSGVGYMGDGPRTSATDQRAHRKWCSMLARVYMQTDQDIARDYSGCSVALEWHNFQNFSTWFAAQPFSTMQRYELDKDLRHVGNRIYSPTTCSIIPKELNMAISADKRRNLHGTGVGYVKLSGRYAACIKYRGKTEYLGTFDTAEEAANMYSAARPSNMNRLADDLLSEHKITVEQAELVKINYGISYGMVY